MEEIIDVNEDETYEDEIILDDLNALEEPIKEEPKEEPVMDEIILSKTMDYGLLNNNTTGNLFHIVDGIKQNKNIMSNVSNNQLNSIQGNF